MLPPPAHHRSPYPRPENDKKHQARQPLFLPALPGKHECANQIYGTKQFLHPSSRKFPDQYRSFYHVRRFSSRRRRKSGEVRKNHCRGSDGTCAGAGDAKECRAASLAAGCLSGNAGRKQNIRAKPRFASGTVVFLLDSGNPFSWRRSIALHGASVLGGRKGGAALSEGRRRPRCFFRDDRCRSREGSGIKREACIAADRD